MLVMLMGQSRVFYSMSVDGLLPKFLVIYMLQIEHLIKQIFFYGIR
jgi:amino acid transporter